MSEAADWGALFRAEGPRLARFLRRLAPRLSAQDLVQDSFERVCAVEPQSITSARGLLYHAARNVVIDASRREAKGLVRAVDPMRIEAVASEPSPEDQRILVDERDALERALAGLPEHKRLALVLLKGDGWSYKEIGERLGVSPRTVERYVADAIAQCHKELRALRDE
jgi:RNA polymerase sigma-70 factor (ECF subfamily)